MGPDRLMGLFGDAFAWLDDRANWRGDQGIIHLTVLHLQVTFLALIIGLVVGLGLGVSLGHLRRGGSVVTVVANLSRAIPTFGLLVVLTTAPAFGVSTRTAVFALGLFAIPPILTNTYTGLTSVDPEAIEASRGLGMTRAAGADPGGAPARVAADRGRHPQLRAADLRDGHRSPPTSATRRSAR